MSAALKPFQQQTYYELLEIHPNASPDEIRAAYERANELYAPDSVAIYALENPSIADELRARITEAMEILTDADLRVEYDRTIGLTPRVAPAEVLRADERDEDEEEEDSPNSAKGMAEVIAPVETVDSTHRELRVSYVGSPAEAQKPAAVEEQPAERPAPNVVVEDPRLPEERVVTRPAPRLESAPVMSHEAAIGEAEAALAQVSARAKDKDARPKPLEIPPDAEFNGELLRRVRESLGLTLAQIADRTRISSRHLENIEADRYKDLPTTVYLRGMLTSLARELRLDQNRVAKSYLALVARKI